MGAEASPAPAATSVRFAVDTWCAAPRARKRHAARRRRAPQTERAREESGEFRRRGPEKARVDAVAPARAHRDEAEIHARLVRRSELQRAVGVADAARRGRRRRRPLWLERVRLDLVPPVPPLPGETGRQLEAFVK
jgi:hypothetical protein